MRDHESTDLESAATLERHRADDLREPINAPSRMRQMSVPLDPQQAPDDPCEDGEHPDSEDGRCLYCGAWLPPYDL
jgi:hypothetical protein